MFRGPWRSSREFAQFGSTEITVKAVKDWSLAWRQDFGAES